MAKEIVACGNGSPLSGFGCRCRCQRHMYAILFRRTLDCVIWLHCGLARSRPEYMPGTITRGWHVRLQRFVLVLVRNVVIGLVLGIRCGPLSTLQMQYIRYLCIGSCNTSREMAFLFLASEPNCERLNRVKMFAPSVVHVVFILPVGNPSHS